jgi:PAS domain S-box-containing protein
MALILMPEPLALMFSGLLGYAVVAWLFVRHPQATNSRLVLLLLPLFLGIFGAVQFAIMLKKPLTSDDAAPLLTSSCLLAVATMIFCAGLIAVFTSLLQRSQRREQHMAAMAATLRFEEAQLSLLVSAISGVLWQRAPNAWNYLSVSQQAEGFLGYTQEEWMSGTNFFLDRVHPQDQPSLIDAWKNSLSKVKRYTVEFRFQKKDGSYAMLCENGVTLPDAHGQLTMCGIMKDISKRHAQAEVQLRAHRQQVEAAHEAGKAEIAKSVLHNIGNVLTSLNVSAKLHLEKLAASRGANLGKAAKLLKDNEGNLARFIKESPQGRRLPAYLISVSEHLAEESRQLYTDAMSMVQHIEHMKDVIALQQVHGRASQVEEAVDLANMFEQSLALEGDVLRDRDIQIERNFADMPPVMLPKNLILQILVNLISNARHAVSAAGVRERKLILSISQPQTGLAMLSVQDTGCGISRNNLQRIFTHGFTTRKEGNGFGLHHAALLVEEIGGKLQAWSEGEGHGASFTLEFPARFAPPALAASAKTITSTMPRPMKGTASIPI